jgi:hypothetical protein
MIKQNNVVAIVGSHPGTRGDFDFSRDDVDAWVFNEAMNTDWCVRADLVFQMHEPAIWKNPKNRNDPLHYEWLQSTDTPPVVMMEKYEEVPNAWRFPIEEVQKLQENTNLNYFTSSVAYAIALAIHLEYDRIEIYGVEMETETEYKFQRTGIGYWVGIGVGRGIDMHVTCEIFNEPMYGYEGGICIDYEDFDKRIEELQPLVDAVQQKFETFRHNYDRDLAIYVKTPTEEMAKALLANARGIAELASQFGALDGALQENQRYKEKADTMMEHSGGTWILVRQEFEQMGQAQFKKLNELQAQVSAMAGQIQAAFEAIARTKNHIRRHRRGNEFIELLNKWVYSVTSMAIMDGASKENYNYSRKLDMLTRAAGGSKSEEVLQKPIIEELKRIEMSVKDEQNPSL